MTLVVARRSLTANRKQIARRRVVAPKPRPPERLAVIDIGSNSIRLVVFDRMSRAPWPLFNEKVQCGLGKGLALTGRLNEDGVISALDNLTRFVTLARAMKAARIELLATAAVRDATNGEEFQRAVKRACGLDLQIITGVDEAHLSAFGVLAGIPDAQGVMGDLGGGSLELVALNGLGAEDHVTLKIGHLRLPEESGGDRARARSIVDQALGQVSWLRTRQGQDFYPVGGAWRGLARMHMEQNNYPLHIIHHYEMTGADALELAKLVGQMSKKGLESLSSNLRKRGEGLIYAAIAMERVLRQLEPRRVVFSAHGLREGYHYSLLPAHERLHDPLLVACAEIEAREARRPNLAQDLDRFLSDVFSDDDTRHRRWRQAICHLSDIGWREHPDYRAQHAFLWALRLPVYGLDHPGRVALALALAARYGGDLDFAEAAAVRSLLDKDTQKWAIAVGAALRLAYSVSGATPDWLNRTKLQRKKSKLVLTLSSDGRRLTGEALDRRFEALGKALGLETKIESASE